MAAPLKSLMSSHVRGRLLGSRAASVPWISFRREYSKKTGGKADQRNKVVNGDDSKESNIKSPVAVADPGFTIAVKIEYGKSDHQKYDDRFKFMHVGAPNDQSDPHNVGKCTVGQPLTEWSSQRNVFLRMKPSM